MNFSREYEVKLDLFEGPLDLLLYLVNIAEVDIAEISVSEISKQYLEYLDVMRELNINIASEYLNMAATLVRLKAQEMLPDAEAEVLLEEEDGIYNRQQLIEKLLEYKKYKEAASSLKIYEAENIGSFTRGMQEEIETVLENEDVSFGTLNIFDLITAFKLVLSRAKEDGPELYKMIKPENIRLDDRIEHVLCMLEDNAEVSFEDFFQDDRRRIVLIVTFIAILELVKMGRIMFRQEEHFSTIYVKKQPDKNKAGSQQNGSLNQEENNSGE
jgi:segregation and condensation protein A